MRMLKFSRLPFLMTIVLLSVGTFVGCSDDPESPDGTEVTVPKEGSTYTYTEYEVDAAGTKDDSTEQSVVATVVETDVTIGGRSNALKISEEFEDGEMDSTYVIYESNGDMSVYLSLEEVEGVDPTWITVPFASHTTKSLTINDTVDDGSGNMAPVSISLEATWLRDEKVTIDGTEMDAWVGQVKFTSTMPGIPTTNASADLYFVPEIGYIYRENETVSFSLLTGRTVRLLTSYSLAN